MMGLLNRVVSHNELDDYVEGYTDMMTANAPLSLKTTNLIVNELLKNAGDRDMSLCHQLVEDCAKSDDLEEGRRAFMEKRKPHFMGR
jgi:enoyl-CoA hydratase/carnithine racemase